MASKPLDARTLRHVARRARAYYRHYDAAEESKRPAAAFAAGLARMAKKLADECVGTAETLERKTKAVKR